MINTELTDHLVGTVLDRLLGLGRARSTRTVITRDIGVPMSDGVELASDHYRPAEVDRGPVVLLRTPYGKEQLPNAAYGRVLARRGLQVVVQDVRGTFGSPGDFEPFLHETDDGLATVAWLREQPWCDGRVAMTGASYVGYTQWAVAPYVEPKLSAIALGITASNFRPTFYPGGSVALQLALSWSATIGTQEDRMPIWERLGLRRRVRRAMSTLPAVHADQAAIGKHVPFLADVLQHAEPDDPYWDLLDHGADLAALDTPASLVAGWYDIFLVRQLRDFTALQEAGTPRRLTVGPWWHGQRDSVPTMFAEQADWLVGHLLGDRAMLDRAPVRVYLQRADRWLDFQQWPVPATPTDLHLGVDGRLTTQIPAEEGIRAFRYDPADPTPTVAGAPLGEPGGQRDNRPIESREDVLVYDTEPLAENLDIIGEGTAEVYLRTEYPDADVFVRVCEVEPGGRSLNVIEGILRLRAADRPDDDLGTRRVQIQLWPTAYRFLRGRRIRVQVSGGAFGNYIRAPHAGRTQILHGPDHPTRITLPRYGG